MFEQLQFIVGHCNESAAQVVLRPYASAEVHSFAASLYGPHCDYSRTLAAEFTFHAAEGSDLHALVTEPCYWTPALPFLYDLRAILQMKDGRELAQTVRVGLRRWDSVGCDFHLEGRRTVLRGAGCPSCDEQTLVQAHAAETVLLVDHYDREFCAAADRLGVGLVLDLRTAGDSLTDFLDQLDWSSSILLALVDADQLLRPEFIRHWPRQCQLAHCLTAASDPKELIDPNTEALAVELQPGELPPAWLASIDRPVIAIRRGQDYADLSQARSACDQLQAELAPEFNLAGYFVAP